MSPDRVTPENVVFFVSELMRRMDHIEERTENLNVVTDAVNRCNDSVHSLRKTLDGIRLMLPNYATKEDVNSFRNALNRAAIGISTSLIIFALTLWATFK